MSRSVINEDGEIIDEIRDGDRILRKESIESFRNLKYIEVQKNESFVKIYTKCLFDMGNDLNGRESSMIYYLLQFLKFDDCILVHSNGKLLTRDFIIRDLNQSESTIDRAISGLIKLGIVIKYKFLDDYGYIINPYVFLKGTKIRTDIAKLFQETKWANK